MFPHTNPPAPGTSCHILIPDERQKNRYMKLLPVFLLILLCAACSGCTAAGTAPSVAQKIPVLAGTWNGSLQGYIEGTGYIAANNTLTLDITGQQGRLFNGTIAVTEGNGSVSVRHIAGAISPDGKSFTVVQSDTGYDFGTIVSDNEIELVYVSDKDPAKVVIDSFVRNS